jgi:dihydroorotate dehydrogenase (subfamily 1) family protein
MLLYELLGMELEDPFIVASGIIPNHGSSMREFCIQYRPSAITTKSFTLSPLDPHPPPTVIKVGECYMNAVGLANPGKDGLRSLDVPCKLIYSLAGSSPEEFGELASLVPKGSPIELNLSSPNRRGMGDSIAPMVREVVREVRSHTDNGILVKFGPRDDVVKLAGRALEAGANGLTLINTLKGMAIDVWEGKPILTYGTGGISGKCIHQLAVRVVGEVYREYGTEIVGVGGIYGWADAVELMLAGAKVVAVGTAIIDRGPTVLNEIREDFHRFLEEKGINATELVGAAVR